MKYLLLIGFIACTPTPPPSAENITIVEGQKFLDFSRKILGCQNEGKLALDAGKDGWKTYVDCTKEAGL